MANKAAMKRARAAYDKAKGAKWIQGMHMKEGALTAQAKRAGQSPMEFARAHQHSPGVTGRRARAAITLSRLHKK